jgi:peroxiredoxin
MKNVKNVLRSGFALATTLVASVLASNVALALNPGDRVDNFRLNDHLSKSHELYYLSDMKAVVLFAQGNSCAAANDGITSIKALGEKYKGQGVAVLGVNSNLNESREAITKAAAAAGIAVPILSDETQLIGESLGFTKNGEVLVVNPKTWQVAYRGGAAQASDAVAALVEGQSVKTAQAPATGCAIAMPERAKRATHANISYAKTVAPILMDKCVACHRTGGIGPWAMTNYELVKGFAPMIREVVRTQRMPPWHSDPHYIAFSNDRSLTNEQTKTLVHWIEAGAPRGAGADPLLSQPKTWSDWKLGEPDLIVKTPPFTVPATGIVPYQNFTVDNPLDHDVWVRAIDYVPGQRSVLHHVIASAGTGSFGGASLNNYVPGADPLQIPEGNGIFLAKGSKFHFQMHYTTSGKELTDVTQFGLYFMKDPPKYNYRAMIMANPMLKIPPNAKEHTVVTESRFKVDSIVYSVHPHSHYRGKSAKFVAVLPDGSEQVLLNVPRYDFNWQTTYDLVKPVQLPAGTRVVYTTVFDNSTQNKANPDPSIEVRWGEQTTEEMVFGVVRYRNVVEEVDADGKLVPNSMPLIDFSSIRRE